MNNPWWLKAAAAGLATCLTVLLLGACGISTDLKPSPLPARTTTSAIKLVPEDNVLAEVLNGTLALNGQTREFTGVDFAMDAPLPTGPGPAFWLVDAVTGDMVMVPLDESGKLPTGELFLVVGDDIWTASDTRFTGGDPISASGIATSRDGDETRFEVTIPLAIGTSTFHLDGDRAVIRGELGSKTFDQMKYLIEAHPEVRTLVLEQIDGSVNDEVNVEIGRLVRRAGLATHVPANGEIYSGGVDLFAAGVTRTAAASATIGVHSWCCGPKGAPGGDLPRDDPAHKSQLSYFTEMLGARNGRAFYFYTLDAATPDGIHTMTPTELKQYQLLTN